MTREATRLCLAYENTPQLQLFFHQMTKLIVYVQHTKSSTSENVHRTCTKRSKASPKELGSLINPEYMQVNHSSDSREQAAIIRTYFQLKILQSNFYKFNRVMFREHKLLRKPKQPVPLTHFSHSPSV